MSSSTVREILLRALFDSAFHSKLVSDPNDVLKEYDITDDERQALIKPSTQLYALMDPTKDSAAKQLQSADDTGQTQTQSPAPAPPPPTTTTTTVIVVIAVVSIVAFAVAAPSTDQGTLRKNLRYQLKPLLGAIRKSGGAERFDLIYTLLTELTKTTKTK